MVQKLGRGLYIRRTLSRKLITMQWASRFLLITGARYMRERTVVSFGWLLLVTQTNPIKRHPIICLYLKIKDSPGNTATWLLLTVKPHLMRHLYMKLLKVISSLFSAQPIWTIRLVLRDQRMEVRVSGIGKKWVFRGIPCRPCDYPIIGCF